MNLVTHEITTPATLVGIGTKKLIAMCDSIGMVDQRNEIVSVFQALVGSWGHRVIGHYPRYRSHIADDQAPFEFSIALSNGEPEVQFYVEAQGESATLRSNMDKGRALLEAIARRVGAPLDRLRPLESLFFPAKPHGPFVIWIGVSWTAGQACKLKVYLNPQVHGAESAFGVAAEAMERLGFGRSWSSARTVLSEGGRGPDELAILSLDLSGAVDARAKVYVRHHHAAVKDIHAIAKATTDYRPDDIDAFYLALAGHMGPFLRKPVLTEMAFVDPGSDRRPALTLEFPIGDYVETDDDACQRIKRCLASFGLPTATYERAFRAFAFPSREGTSGVHAHVTLRRMPHDPRIGVYLASQAYGSDGAGVGVLR